MLDDRFWTIMETKGWAIFSEQAKDLMSGMLNPNPLRRMTVAQVLAHPFLNPANPLTDGQIKDIVTVERGHANVWMEVITEQQQSRPGKWGQEQKEVVQTISATPVLPRGCEMQQCSDAAAAKQQEITT